MSIGGGNMAQAILLGAIERGAIGAGEVVVADPSDAARGAFEAAGVRAVERASEAVGALGQDGQVLLAVKPQVLDGVAADLGGEFDGVVISILAGAGSSRVSTALRGARVVRAMPNTPARVGRGITAISLGAGVRPGDDALAARLFGAVGEVVRIDESLMDAFTGVAGSGPAYVFLLAEGMARGAEAAGFDARMADRIVRATIAGAAALLESSADVPASELRRRVTSRGGTTAAALEALEDAGMAAALERAVVAARDRGRELGA